MLSEVPFGEFLPDQPDYKNPGCIRAENVIPTAGGYGPLRGAGNTSGTATGVCRGGALLRRSTGAAITVGGGATRLWVDVAGTVVETTGLTDIGADAYWQFEQFNGRVFAVAPNNDLQELTDIDTDTTWSAVSDAPAQAEVIGKVGQHLMVGALSSNPYAIQWSGLNQPRTFTADALNLAGTGEARHEYGKITGIVGDRYPLLFQQYGISRITPVGPPLVFRIEPIEEARGAIAPNAIVPVGFLTYYISDEGFCVTNGAGSQLIGSQRVNEFFKEDVSDTDLFRMHGTVDWTSQSVIWAYYPKEGTGFTKLVIYSWAENRFSTGTLPVQWLLQGTTSATTIDGLTNGVDTYTQSFDAAEFRARGRNLSAYVESGSNAQLVALDGDALQAVFETGDTQPQPGKRAYISKVYPIIENSDANTQAIVITKNKKGGMETLSTPGTINDAGFCPVRADGRFARVRSIIPAGSEWEKAQGVQIDFRVSGAR